MDGIFVWNERIAGESDQIVIDTVELFVAI